MKIIARIHSDFPEKFGIPRQSGLVEALEATIVFEPEYRNPAALMGITGYSHLWLLWQFSEAVRDTWSPTVHPPRLGGKKHMGVFATRSPFRPNPIGLSSVRLLAVENDPKLGPILRIAGADTISSPICLIPTAIPMRWAALPTTMWRTQCRWYSRRSCYLRSPRISGRLSWASCPRTPDLPTRMTRSAFMVWPLEIRMYGFV